MLMFILGMVTMAVIVFGVSSYALYRFTKLTRNSRLTIYSKLETELTEFTNKLDKE